MALLNSCMKLKIFLLKSILLKQYENGNKKKYSQLVPGSAKVKKGNFLKKSLARIDFVFDFDFDFILGSYAPLKAWNAKLEAGIFLAV